MYLNGKINILKRKLTESRQKITNGNNYNDINAILLGNSTDVHFVNSIITNNSFYHIRNNNLRRCKNVIFYVFKLG